MHSDKCARMHDGRVRCTCGVTVSKRDRTSALESALWAADDRLREHGDTITHPVRERIRNLLTDVQRELT